LHIYFLIIFLHNLIVKLLFLFKIEKGKRKKEKKKKSKHINWKIDKKEKYLKKNITEISMIKIGQITI